MSILSGLTHVVSQEPKIIRAVALFAAISLTTQGNRFNTFRVIERADEIYNYIDKGTKPTKGDNKWPPK